ncbi:Hypothetical predicted protein [Octopus vulgaris]|uniref:Uncharacterized protein n=1 Tax=Octopus vulgaris TaxID=6645 RepID=A0AA36B854_OCTVU|nr:Hypothetical predicted protein [Octopus vulgaris]
MSDLRLPLESSAPVLQAIAVLCPTNLFLQEVAVRSGRVGQLNGISIENTIISMFQGKGRIENVTITEKSGLNDVAQRILFMCIPFSRVVMQGYIRDFGPAPEILLSSNSPTASGFTVGCGKLIDLSCGNHDIHWAGGKRWSF